MACLEAVKREDEGSKIDESKTDEDKTSTAAAAESSKEEEGKTFDTEIEEL